MIVIHKLIFVDLCGDFMHGYFVEQCYVMDDCFDLYDASILYFELWFTRDKLRLCFQFMFHAFLDLFNKCYRSNGFYCKFVLHVRFYAFDLSCLLC